MPSLLLWIPASTSQTLLLTCPSPVAQKSQLSWCLKVPRGSGLTRNKPAALLGHSQPSGVFPTDPKCPDTLPSGRTICRYSHTFSSLFGCSMKCPSFRGLLPLLGATFSATLLQMLSSLLLVTCLPAAPRPHYHRAKMCLLFSTVYCGSLAHNHLRQREKEGKGERRKETKPARCHS